MPIKPLIPNAETNQAVADGRARKGATVQTSIAERRKPNDAVSPKERKPVGQKLTKKAEAKTSGNVL